MRFQLGVAALPRICKRLGYVKKSEDAYFLIADGSGGLRGGLADGVGGLSVDFSIDSGIYAESLIRYSFKRASKKTKLPLSPTEIIKSSWKKISEEKTQGASTLLVFVIDKNGQLNASNIGDSSLMVLRGGLITAVAPTSQLHFDRPAQLGFLDEKNRDFFQTPSSVVELDPPVILREGDLVFCMSDGITDNLDSGDIEKIVTSRPFSAAPELALAIVESAQARALDTTRDSPFSLVAKQNDVAWSYGGRVDDITCLAVRVLGEGGEGLEGGVELPATLSPAQLCSKLLPQNAAEEKSSKHAIKKSR